MGVIFNSTGSAGGYPCEAPDDLYERCMEATPRLPVVPWFGNANRFIHPIGCSRPGYGAILLKRKYLYALPSVVKSYKVKFTCSFSNGEEDYETFANLRIVGTPICISPGVPQDDDATMFVELADRRVDCVGLCGNRYNWRIHPDSPYETASLNAGAAWTWTTLITDIWNAVGNLGTMPALPVTPAGVPEQIDGMACRAADLLDDLLMLGGMGVAYDPSADTFSIVSFSANASTFIGRRLAEASLGAVGQRIIDRQDRVIWDQEPVPDNLPKLPAYVRVVFPVWSAGGTPIDTASYYVVDVADTTPGATQLTPSSFALVQDFFVCRTNQVGTVLNSANLVSRAADVASNWYAQARKGSFFPYHQTFSGIGGGSVVLPGAAIDVMCWEDVGDGAKTHIIQTGRLGFSALFHDTPHIAGLLLTGHPFGAATNIYRYPVASLNQADPIQRGANIPPGELRTYGTGPFATVSGNTAASYAGGGGMSSIMERIGPLRQWDSAVEARSIDGHGQRLWLAKQRMQFSAFVKITSLSKAGTSGNLYPAIECLIDPITQAITTGAICWWYDPSGSTPALNSKHWSYLDGTDTAFPAGGVSPAKVYMSSESSTPSRIYGQDDDVSLPGDGPRQTIQILEAHPTLGDTATVTLGDDAANDRLIFTIDALGVFGRANATAPTYGPRRRVDVIPLALTSPLSGKTNVAISIADDVASDEFKYTIDNQGVFGSGDNASYLGPERSVKIERAVPASLLINVAATVADVPINQQLEWTIDNLGIFGRVNDGTTSGPRRRIDFDDDIRTTSYGTYTVLSWAVADEPAEDEIEFKATLNIPNIFAVGGGLDWSYYKHVGYNRWHGPHANLGFQNQVSLLSTTFFPSFGGIILLVPYLEVRGGTLDRIGIQIQTGATTAGAKLRLGIYKATSATNLAPGTLLLDAGTIVIDNVTFPTPGAAKITISQPLAPGMYWLAIRLDQTSGNCPTLQGSNTPDQNRWACYGIDGSAGLDFTHTDGVTLLNDAYLYTWGLDSQGALAALPTPFPGGASTFSYDKPSPLVWVRYSS